MSSQKPSIRKIVVGEVQENISVGLRVKPNDTGDKMCQYLDDKNIKIRKTNEVFSFDEVFNEQSDSNEIFVKFLAPVINRFIQGYNGAICAYGQTSSGKTFTMKGTPELPGLIPLAIQNIFAQMKDFIDSSCSLKVSYVELYNETIFDLLTPNRTIVEIRENQSTKGVFLQDVKQESVTSFTHFMSLFTYGEEQRQFGETKMNENSSRSHVLLQLTLENRLKKSPYMTQISQLCLVDLAGSEGVSKTQSDGLRRKEGCLINRSLLALQNVVKQLKEHKQNKFVNFRDSKLTRLLQNSLCGNSMTVFLLTISQVQDNMQESLNTIRFGMAAGAIKNNIKLNCIQEEEKEDQTQIQLLIDQIDTLEEEKQSAIQTIEELTDARLSLEKEMVDMSNQILLLKQKLTQMERFNFETMELNQDLTLKKQELMITNERIQNHLLNYVQTAEQRGLYRSQLFSSECQTDFPQEKDKCEQLLEQVQHMKQDNEDLRNQLKRIDIQRDRATSPKQRNITPLKELVQNSMQKNTDYLRSLALNSELQSDLIQKSKELLLLKRVLDDKDKQCRYKEAQLFEMRQLQNDSQLIDTHLPQSMVSFKQKKKVVNSPSKEELKKSLLRQELRSQAFVKEIDRYQKNLDLSFD